MPLTELNHYLLVAKNLERTKNFYCDVLGLELAERPDFGFPGYWLKIGEEICVHLASQEPNKIRDMFLLKKHPKGTKGSGSVDQQPSSAVPPSTQSAPRGMTYVGAAGAVPSSTRTRSRPGLATTTTWPRTGTTDRSPTRSRAPRPAQQTTTSAWARASSCRLASRRISRWPPRRRT